MNSIIKLDTRGRLVIPNEFREALALKEGDDVLLSLDRKTDTITISPIYGKTTDLVKMELEFGDVPGCLAKIAEKIADLKIDLVMTESKSSQRGKKLGGTSSQTSQNVHILLMKLNNYCCNLVLWNQRVS